MKRLNNHVAMTTVNEPEQIVSAFVDMILKETFEPEHAILGLQTGFWAVNRFNKKYRPLVVLLWFQALAYTHREKAGFLFQSFMRKYYRHLVAVDEEDAFGAFCRALDLLNDKTVRENGILRLAHQYVKEFADKSLNPGERTLRLTRKILERLNDFVEELAGTEIVEQEAGAEQFELSGEASREAEQEAEAVDEIMSEMLSDEFHMPGSFVTYDQLDGKVSTVQKGGGADLDFNRIINGLYMDDVGMTTISKARAGSGEAGPLRDDRGGGRERRRERRFRPLNVRIFLEYELREMPVKDLSMSGIGFFHQGWNFEPHQKLRFDIYDRYKIVLKGVLAEVVRMDRDTVGCVFMNMEDEEKLALSSLAFGFESVE